MEGLFAALLLVTLPSVARADEELSERPSPSSSAFTVSLGGTSAWLPLVESSPLRVGIVGEVGWERSLRPGLSVGLRLLLRAFPDEERVSHWQYGLGGRVEQMLLPLGASFRLGGTISAGVGVWEGCLRGDFCGGFGPTAGVGLTVSTNEATGGRLEAGVDAQSGLVNGVAVAVLPRLMVTIAF